MKESKCFSCGARVPEIQGSVHRYMASSPGCWATYGEVLAREYSNPSYFRYHRLTVDAYALQHPGTPSLQAIQSIALHLCSLYTIFECGSEMSAATNLMKRMSKYKTNFSWLEPPKILGSITVRKVWESEGADAHLYEVQEWAKSTWLAWEKHHSQVRTWVKLCS